MATRTEPVARGAGGGAATGTVRPLDEFERRLIDGWQRGFPLCERPYATIARRLGTDEDEVLSALSDRLADGVVSRIGAVFRPNVVGASTLAAIRVPRERLEEVAALVSARAEVHHNYEREHAINLWFVAAAQDEQRLHEALEAIERESGLDVLRLPLERDYWIDLGFGMDGVVAHRMRTSRGRASPGPVVLDARDERLIAALDDGLAPVSRPYDELARRADLTEAYVCVRIADWLNRGVISRFGLVVRHRPLGWTANAMCVWDVPAGEVDALGAALAAEQGVTLAYRRARADGWPYNLYAMIHGCDRDAVTARREAIAATLGLDRHRHDVLFSLAAYKQRGARYGRGDGRTPTHRRPPSSAVT